MILTLSIAAVIGFGFLSFGAYVLYKEYKEETRQLEEEKTNEFYQNWLDGKHEEDL